MEAISRVRLLALGALIGLLVSPSCKPESEPDWPYGDPPGAPVAVLTDADEVDPGSADDDFADGEDGADGLPETLAEALALVESEGEADGDSEAATALDAATLLALRRPLSAADREAAEREAGTAGRLRRNLQLREALQHYRAALERMPGHADANYGAAVTLALLGAPAEAARHVAVLAAIDTDAARRLLAQARRDADLRPLRAEPMFRAAAGFGRIVVAVGDGGPGDVGGRGRARLEAGLLRRLAEAHLPAEAGPPAAVLPPEAARVTTPEIYHANSPAALGMAREVAEALGETAALRRGQGGLLEDLSAEVLVLWPYRDDDPPPPSEEEGPQLTELLDRRLQARDDYGLRLLRLRSTGFFEMEERARAGDEIRRRRGRYRLADGGTIALEYEETLERYPEESDMPEITTSQGAMEVPFALLPDGSLRFGEEVYRLPE